MSLQGRAKVGSITKKLVDYLCREDIAIIHHDDIDELTAAALVQTGICAVINTGTTMTGRFKAEGARTLLCSGLLVVDSRLTSDYFNDNDLVTIMDNDIIINDTIYKNVCSIVDMEYIRSKKREAEKNENAEIIKFIVNTTKHTVKDMIKIVSFSDYPNLETRLEGRHTIVVARNRSSFEELKALKNYIRNYDPIFIGVDGGADLIIKSGYIPDILIGDMDSVSDIGIYRSREIILHAYEDGNCPCLGRIGSMNVHYSIIKLRGTSEDAALMLAYRKKSELIVLVGGHSCMSDFMNKGRKGMASTFITRTLIGGKLVDCKGFGTVAASESEGKDLMWAKM